MNTPVFTRRLTVLLMLGSLALRGPVGFAADALPAPVPAEVAIARPSAAEVAQVTQNVQRLLTQADPATKAILAKYPDLLAIHPPRVNPATVPFLNPGFRAKHDANVEIAKKGDIDLLLMGDSITDFWRNSGPAGTANPPRAGKAIFDQYYGTMKVANFGIGGDFTQGVLYRLQNGEGQGFQPKAIMLMIGTNNYTTCTSAEIAEGVGAVVLELRKDFPAAKILLLGIFPRGTPGDVARRTVQDVNPIIAKLHDGQHVFYLDIGAKFLTADGTLEKSVMPDLLHLNAASYKVEADAIRDKLASLAK